MSLHGVAMRRMLHQVLSAALGAPTTCKFIKVSFTCERKYAGGVTAVCSSLDLKRASLNRVRGFGTDYRAENLLVLSREYGKYVV